MISLPIPPTTNKLYAHTGKNRFATQAYKNWQIEAGYILNGYNKRYTKPVKLTLVVFFKARHLSDVANREKAILDLLVKHKILIDDNWKYVQGNNQILGGFDRDKPRVEVYIEEIENPIT